MSSRSGMGWMDGRAARLLGALAVLVAVRAAPAQPVRDPVSLQLPGLANFRFAGYYAALDRGMYAEEGLDVTIIEGHVDLSPADVVMSGAAQFGVMASELVQARLSGKRVVALAAVFQKSGYCFLSASDSLISAPADLTGKRVVLATEKRDVELRAFLFSAGVALRDLSIESPTNAEEHMKALSEGRVDVIRACLTHEPGLLQLRGMPVSVMRPSGYGVDFYGDALFTSEAEVQSKRARVEAFRRASLKGWRYALEHREEVIDGLLRRHNAAERSVTRELLRMEAGEVRDLILPDLVPIGQMNAERWARTAKMLTGLGLVTEASPGILDGFVFDPNPPPTRPGLVRWLTLGLAGALSGIAIFMIWSLQLRQAVSRRTREYKESMRRLVEAQAIGHVGDWELDLGTRQIAFSEEMYRLFELDPARGVPSFDEMMTFFSAEDQALIKRNMDKAITQGVEVRTDTRPRLASGKLRYLSGIMTPVRDGSGAVVKLIGVTQDITQTKVQEAGLVSSEARYRTLIDHAPDAIVTMDMQTGCYVEANPRACELYGLARDVLLTKSPVDLSPPFQPDGRPSAESAMEKIEEAIRGGSPVFRWDHLRSDGSIVPCEIRLIRLPGEGTLVRGSMTDISDRLRAEEALNRRSAELERSNRELERFAYVASHDLQEPLRMVTSFTQLLAQRYAGKLGTDADDFIGFAVDGAKRMQLLIDDLLAYSRAGRRDVRLTRVEADRALDDALSNLKGTIEGEGAIVTRDPLPAVTADPTQFVQLFQNLVSNAVKFRAEAPPRIHISARRDNGEWVFEVKDNGIGIDPAHQGKLFVMFQRLHPRHRYPGTGIGLALCKLIVERMGGRVFVESAPGAGSTFGFTVPAPQEEPA